MLVVAALGGNALLKRGEKLSAENQRANVWTAAMALAEIVRAGHRLIVTHGNGPQVGLLALQSAAGPIDGQYPLDVLGAESEGMIGYMIEQELRNALPEQKLFATLLTQSVVEASDPAFLKPSKPIGPVYDEATAKKLAAARGWTVAPDGTHWRRVVASPKPMEILEAPEIALLSGHGAILICTGGGGIPVTRDSMGALKGIEAVVDKDLASALLAGTLGADKLLLLTDVDAVYAGYGTAEAHAIRRTTPESLREQDFASGSMGPKVEAAAGFVEATGKSAAIGKLQDAVVLLRGDGGTQIESKA
ncbi:carbamate kinase [Dongia sedimenti]|uniref:Carbamate kinase n=1 Tax=Dongia sedimenti TaxID=3064282 RepID=A0ABU0YP92_9PROT|nr:carbamate kinase [Rhodospirillaceae bacterium R-7]